MGAENCADGCGRRGCKGEMGGEKKPLEISERGCADGCGRRGCNGVAGNGWGEEAAGDQRAWVRGRLRTGNGCGELRGRLRTAADGVGATEWLEMGGEKTPLVMSELGCAAAADGKWVRRIARTAADGVGARVAGNGW